MTILVTTNIPSKLSVISGDSERGHGSISKVCTPVADDSSERLMIVSLFGSEKLSTHFKGKVSDYPESLPKEQWPKVTTPLL